MSKAKGIEPMKIRAATETAVYRFTWWDRYAGKEVVMNELCVAGQAELHDL